MEKTMFSLQAFLSFLRLTHSFVYCGMKLGTSGNWSFNSYLVGREGGEGRGPGRFHGGSRQLRRLQMYMKRPLKYDPTANN